jgi:hypothetical protein
MDTQTSFGSFLAGPLLKVIRYDDRLFLIRAPPLSALQPS